MPGSTAKMDPRPDHAETSYKSLGKRAVITGGESGIGRAVAIAFAREDILIADLDESEDANEVAALTQKEGNKAFRSAMIAVLSSTARCGSSVAAPFS
jgi:NAD(P)-dependent dehydrogenase (short-subunit alcohol dehydrogenase family)